MFKLGDVVKVISTTEHLGEQKEFIPIGSACKIVNIDTELGCTEVAYHIVPCNAPIDYIGYWYLESEIENISTEDKYVSVENLIRTFEDMANRGSLLARGNVSQQDLLMQIIGTIVHVSMNDTHMNSDLNRKEINQ